MTENTHPYHEEQFIAKRNTRTYHYTSPSAMKSILENRTLRFTDCQFLNDKSEYTYFGGILEEALDSLLNRLPNRTIEMVQEVYDHNYDAEGRLIGHKREDGKRGYSFQYIPARYYLFCTSLGRDSLHMWNYYIKSGNYQGYNLGLDIRELEQEFAKYNGHYIEMHSGKVIYRRNDQIAILRDFITDMDKQIARLKDIDAEDLVDGVQQEMLDRIQYYRLLFKHHSFEEEKEYRFILKAPRDMEETETEGISPGFCENHGVLVPYCDISISMNALKTIVMAPMVEAEIAREGLFRFLHKNHYEDDIELNISDVPIRY